MVTLINSSNVLGKVIDGVTQGVTGDTSFTFLVFIYMFVALSSMFRIPTFVAILITMPFIFIAVAYTSSLMAVIIMCCLYLAAVMVRIFFLNA
jgi:hypothetical protein